MERQSSHMQPHHLVFRAPLFEGFLELPKYLRSILQKKICCSDLALLQFLVGEQQG